ncbi:histone-lysine N-methyltransferase SETD2 isoform X2 [Hyperolius riggenbachi]|uniref:histone-lysine N-methyltransferase SETD2 isoform X2 n=1 Tax=Hyperolius riggenbachi TaxID=752182 RepID=UPI0035A29364
MGDFYDPEHPTEEEENEAKNENAQQGFNKSGGFKSVTSSRFLPKGTKAKVNLEEQGRQKVSFSFSFTKKTLQNRLLTALASEKQTDSQNAGSAEPASKSKTDVVESPGAAPEVPPPKPKVELGKIHFKKHLLVTSKVPAPQPPPPPPPPPPPVVPVEVPTSPIASTHTISSDNTASSPAPEEASADVSSPVPSPEREPLSTSSLTAIKETDTKDKECSIASVLESPSTPVVAEKVETTPVKEHSHIGKEEKNSVSGQSVKSNSSPDKPSSKSKQTHSDTVVIGSESDGDSVQTSSSHRSHEVKKAASKEGDLKRNSGGLRSDDSGKYSSSRSKSGKDEKHSSYSKSERDSKYSYSHSRSDRDRRRSRSRSRSTSRSRSDRGPRGSSSYSRSERSHYYESERRYHRSSPYRTRYSRSYADSRARDSSDSEDDYKRTHSRSSDSRRPSSSSHSSSYRDSRTSSSHSKYDRDPKLEPSYDYDRKGRTSSRSEKDIKSSEREYYKKNSPQKEIKPASSHYKQDSSSSSGAKLNSSKPLDAKSEHGSSGSKMSKWDLEKRPDRKEEHHLVRKERVETLAADVRIRRKGSGGDVQDSSRTRSKDVDDLSSNNSRKSDNELTDGRSSRRRRFSTPPVDEGQRQSSSSGNDDLSPGQTWNFVTLSSTDDIVGDEQTDELPYENSFLEISASLKSEKTHTSRSEIEKCRFKEDNDDTHQRNGQSSHDRSSPPASSETSISPRCEYPSKDQKLQKIRAKGESPCRSVEREDIFSDQSETPAAKLVTLEPIPVHDSHDFKATRAKQTVLASGSLNEAQTMTTDGEDSFESMQKNSDLSSSAADDVESIDNAVSLKEPQALKITESPQDVKETILINKISVESPSQKTVLTPPHSAFDKDKVDPLQENIENEAKPVLLPEAPTAQIDVLKANYDSGEEDLSTHEAECVQSSQEVKTDSLQVTTEASKPAVNFISAMRAYYSETEESTSEESESEDTDSDDSGIPKNRLQSVVIVPKPSSITAEEGNQSLSPIHQNNEEASNNECHLHEDHNLVHVENQVLDEIDSDSDMSLEEDLYSPKPIAFQAVEQNAVPAEVPKPSAHFFKTSEPTSFPVPAAEENVVPSQSKELVPSPDQVSEPPPISTLVSKTDPKEVEVAPSGLTSSVMSEPINVQAPQTDSTGKLKGKVTELNVIHETEVDVPAKDLGPLAGQSSELYPNKTVDQTPTIIATAQPASVTVDVPQLFPVPAEASQQIQVQKSKLESVSVQVSQTLQGQSAQLGGVPIPPHHSIPVQASLPCPIAVPPPCSVPVQASLPCTIPVQAPQPCPSPVHAHQTGVSPVESPQPCPDQVQQPCPPPPLQAQQPCPPPPLQAQQPCPPPPLQAQQPCPPQPLQAQQPCSSPPLQAQQPCPPPPLQAQQPCSQPPLQAQQPCPPPPLQAQQPCPPPPLQAQQPCPPPPLQAQQPCPPPPLQAQQPCPPPPLQAQQPCPPPPLQAQQPCPPPPLQAQQPCPPPPLQAQQPCPPPPLQAQQPCPPPPLQAQQPCPPPFQVQQQCPPPPPPPPPPSLQVLQPCPPPLQVQQPSPPLEARQPCPPPPRQVQQPCPPPQHQAQQPFPPPPPPPLQAQQPCPLPPLQAQQPCPPPPLQTQQLYPAPVQVPPPCSPLSHVPHPYPTLIQTPQPFSASIQVLQPCHPPPPCPTPIQASPLSFIPVQAQQPNHHHPSSEADVSTSHLIATVHGRNGEMLIKSNEMQNAVPPGHIKPTSHQPTASVPPPKSTKFDPRTPHTPAEKPDSRQQLAYDHATGAGDFSRADGFQAVEDLSDLGWDFSQPEKPSSTYQPPDSSYMYFGYPPASGVCDPSQNYGGSNPYWDPGYPSKDSAFNYPKPVASVPDSLTNCYNEDEEEVDDDFGWEDDQGHEYDRANKTYYERSRESVSVQAHEISSNSVKENLARNEKRELLSRERNEMKERGPPKKRRPDLGSDTENDAEALERRKMKAEASLVEAVGLKPGKAGIICKMDEFRDPQHWKDFSRQGKMPPYFDLIEENVYLTERKKNKSHRDIKRMQCECPLLSKEERAQGDVACGDDCLNRLLMIECSSRCPNGDYCSNRRFQRKQHADVEAILTDKKGWGLRAGKELKPNTFVLEYCGEVLDHKEFKGRVKEYARNKNIHYYFMALKNDEIIDATLKGNCSRFMNHSCDPNCETQKWTVNGQLRVGFFTTRAVPPGAELTFDYQFQRYGKEAQKCFCGAANCRGYIGGENRVSVRAAGGKMKKERSRKKDSVDGELEALLENGEGLSDKNQVLSLSRLMVRIETLEQKLTCLKLIRNTQSQSCLKLFLECHGLSLLWIWMAELGDSRGNTSNSMKLQLEIIRTLELLPIPNKNMLEESKILPIIQRWAQTKMSIPFFSEGDGYSSENTSRAHTPLNTPTNTPDPAHKLSIEIEGETPKKLVLRRLKIVSENSMDSAASDPTSEVEIKEVTVKPETPTIDEPKEGEKLKEEIKGEEVPQTAPITEDQPAPAIKTEEEPPTEGSKDSSAGPEVPDAEPKDPSSLKVEEASAVETPSQDEEEGISDVESERSQEQPDKMIDMSDLASKLLDGWKDLREVYRIPKKTPAEKENHDRHKESSGGNYPTPKSQPRERERESERQSQRKRKQSPSPPSFYERSSKRGEDKYDTPASSKKKGRLQDRNKLSTEERRKLFEQEVAQREAQKQQQQMQNIGMTSPIPYEPVPPYNNQLPPPFMHYPQGYPIQSFVDPTNPNAGKVLLPTPPLDVVNSPNSYDPSQGMVVNPAMMTPQPVPVVQHVAPPMEVSSQQYVAQPESMVPQDPNVTVMSVPAPNAVQAPPYGVWDPKQPPVPVQQHQAQPPYPPAPAQPALYYPGQACPAVYGVPAPYPQAPQPMLQGYTQPGLPYMPGQIYAPHPQGVVMQQAPPVAAIVPPGQPPAMQQPEMGLPANNIMELPPPSPPKPKTIVLPPGWKTARDPEGKIYYYHVITRQTQWDPPSWDNVGEDTGSLDHESEMDLGTPTYDESPMKSSKKTKTAEADTSSELAKKSKEVFRKEMSQFIVQCLNPYRKPDCKIGRINTTEDFKHLARKLTHGVMNKELKYCKNPEDLDCNENVKHKTKEYIKKYMQKFGSVYKPKEDIDME